MVTKREHLINASGTNLVSKAVSLDRFKSYSVSVFLDSGPVSAGDFTLEVSNGMNMTPQGEPTDWEVLDIADLSLPSNANTSSWMFLLASAPYGWVRVRTNSVPSLTVRADIVMKD